ncbi:MAG TPA: ubiquinol-cytochrome c reductase iron-sulfur subunit [Holophaga sp.]|nr:ubiquinol-cytochrome c reductase iron-sulfur subunit [Holophaga sp.]
MTENTRRTFLQLVTSIPIVGGAVLAATALLRYFKPTMVGGPKGLVAPPDEAGSSVQAVAALSELTQPWDFKEFIYIRKSVEYSSRKIQGAKIPGFVVRVPDEFADPKDPRSKFVVVQRICPHLGCTFNFVKSPEELSGGYNYKPPAPTHPYFACPCHLSVYDPTRRQEVNLQGALPGKVVSGPAPRPPRTMTFDIKDGQILITGTEGGGVG